MYQNLTWLRQNIANICKGAVKNKFAMSFKINLPSVQEKLNCHDSENKLAMAMKTILPYL